MPSSKNYVRDYKQEYATAKRRKEVAAGSNGDNAKRKAARRKLQSAGVSVKGKDVAHKDNNPKNNSMKNLAVQSKKANRSFSRNKKAGRK
jgi:hypothetical protein